MKYLIITLSYLALAAAQCGPHGCPEPERPPQCGVPDCSNPTNRYHENALFPTRDPTMYWQCAPYNATHWAALQRHCACGTVFNYNLRPPRCSFWYDDTWSPDIACGWTSPPLVRECVPECPTCGLPGLPTLPPPGLPTPPPQGPTTTPSNECPCNCAPCIWWPCVPCPPTCPCSSMRG